MDSVVLDFIKFELNKDLLIKELYIDKVSFYRDRINKFIDIASQMARPKAMYREAKIQFKGEDYIIVDGVKLTSTIMRENLEDADRIFPYICTCGWELDQWSQSLDDILERYWADKIMEMILRESVKGLECHMDANYRLGPSSSMNPGSLEDWPISQQKELFAILGDPYKEIGVKLTEDYLMLPLKSVSGIRFSSEVNFVNCSLCPREICGNRVAEYDHLYNQNREK